MAQSSVIGLLRVLLTANTAEYDGNMKSASDKAKAFTKDLKTFGKHATEVGSALTKAFTVPIVGLGLAVTKLAIDFEDSFAGVRKTVDATETEFDQMALAFRQLSKEIPVNVNELNKLGEAAGALGIPKEEIVDFARVMAEFGVTTNLTSDQAADAIARIQNIFGAAGKDTERLASTIVALGNAGASTEKEITEMAQRIAGAGHTVGLTQAQVVSFASTLASVGINAEAGGSAISRIFLKMNDAVANGGKGLQEFARVSGTTAAKFKQDFEKDAAGATSAFISGLGRLKASGENINSTIEGLIGKNIILKDTLFRLSGAGQLLNEQLAIGDKAWQDNTALTIEAGKRFETTSSQMTLLWNRIKDVGVTLGNALLPLIRSTVGALDGLLPIVERVGAGFGALPGPIQALVVGIGLAVAAAGPLILVFGQLALSAAALTAAFGAAGAAGAVGVFGTALAAIANPITLTIAALGLVSLAVYGVVTAETELERAVRENAAGFKAATTVLESSLDVYNRLIAKQGLTKTESQDLDKATRALAEASGLSVDAFNREERASHTLTEELKKQLAERQRLFTETVRQARTGAVEALSAVAKAREELRKLLAGETQKVEVVGVPGKVDPQTRAFTGSERAKEVERLTKTIEELEKKAGVAEKAFSKLSGGVSNDSMTFKEWGLTVDKSTKAATKGIKTTGDEVEETGRKSRTTTSDVQRLADELNKMRADLSGVSAIAGANRMLEALKQLPPVQQLTVEAQRRINTVMGEAIDVYRAYGVAAPQNIGAVYKATLQLGSGMKAVSGLPKDMTAGLDTWLNTWSRGIPIISGLGVEFQKLGTIVPIASGKIGSTLGTTLTDSLTKSLERIPQLLMSAFTGGGGLDGALKAIGVMVATSILTPLMDGLSKAAKSAVSIGSGLSSLLGGAVAGGTGAQVAGIASGLGGAAVAATAWGVKMSAAGLAGTVALSAATLGIGAAAAGVAVLIKHLTDPKGRRAVEEFAASFVGGFDGLQKELLKGGAAGEALWIKITQGTAKTNPEEAKKNIAEVIAFLSKLKTAEEAAGGAAASAAATHTKALEEIAAKYAETLSQIDSERKSLIDRIAAEAPEEFMGLMEIADRARLAELDAQKAAVEEKQRVEEEAANASFQHATEMAMRTLEDIQDIFSQGVEIPIRYTLPESAPVEGFARGTQGFRDFGRGTLAMLHGIEAVVRPGDTAAGVSANAAAAPVTLNLHVDQSGSYFDSERTADRVTRQMFERIRNGGATLSEFQSLVVMARGARA